MDERNLGVGEGGEYERKDGRRQGYKMIKKENEENKV